MATPAGKADQVRDPAGSAATRRLTRPPRGKRPPATEINGLFTDLQLKKYNLTYVLNHPNAYNPRFFHQFFQLTSLAR